MRRKGLAFVMEQIRKGVNWFDDMQAEIEHEDYDADEYNDDDELEARVSQNEADMISDVDSEIDDPACADIEDAPAQAMAVLRPSKRRMQNRFSNGDINLRSFSTKSYQFKVDERDFLGVYTTYFPSQVAQSTFEGTGERYACSITCLLVCQWFMFEKADFAVGRHLPDTFVSVICSAIRVGSHLYNETRESLPKRFLSIEEASTVLLPWFSTVVDDVIDIQSNDRSNSLDYHLERLLKLKKDLVALFSSHGITTIFLLSKDGDILFLYTHAKMSYGVIVLRSTITSFQDFYGTLWTLMCACVNIQNDKRIRGELTVIEVPVS